jgi:hypothetical protein
MKEDGEEWERDIRLEEFRLNLRELEVIEIGDRWGIFPM